MWDYYYTVTSISEALEILFKEKEKAKIIAGGTDLVLELKKNSHPEVVTLIDITRISGLDRVWEEGDYIYISPMVTHNHALASKLLINYALPLVKAAQSIGAAQIRNIGTIFGNLITASPANDSISPLMALGAELCIESLNAKKWVNISDFYLGVRETILKADEIVTSIRFKKMRLNQRGSFIKYLLRNTHGISVANATVILTIEDEVIKDAKITLGSVAPTIIRSEITEKYLLNKSLNPEIIVNAGKMCLETASPISDIRASEQFRSHLIPVMVEQALTEIQTGSWKEFSEHPVLLWGRNRPEIKPLEEKTLHSQKTPIVTKINHKNYSLSTGQNNTLLNLVRNEAELTGTKSGCGEGECGACTLHLNGLPVLSCLIPAPRAHLSEITTIEGISDGEKLHPVQQAFIDEAAVQCGYCTPGFIMSSVTLLEEKPHPNSMEIREGLAGNICRCTGYYSIIRAVEKAANEIASKAKEAK